MAREAFSLQLARGVRLYQRTEGGPYYLSRVGPDGRKIRESLETRDLAVARQVALERLGAPMAMPRLVSEKPLEVSDSASGLTISQVVTKYLASPSSQDLVARKDVVRATRHLERLVGPDTRWESITKDTWKLYRRRRLAEKTPRGTPLREGSVARELAYLRAMASWAVTEGETAHHAFTGVKISQERSPRRPLLGAGMPEVFRKLTRVARKNGREALYRALWLARETGRRRKALVGLAWEDVDLGKKTIRWRAWSDKGRREWVVPMSDALVREMKQWRQEGVWVCGNPKTGRATHPNSLTHWLEEVFDETGIERPELGGWHMFRRQFVNDRKDAPVKDLMELGGWSQVSTVLGIYQVADEQSMRRVLNGTGKSR